MEPLYYPKDFRSEIDFLIQDGTDIIPLEVKAGEITNAASFKRYIREEKPRYAVKLSELPLKDNEVIKSVPLYLAHSPMDIPTERPVKQLYLC